MAACPPTRRAKQGGRQAGKDATGKFAKSAGSQLRRYNEVLRSFCQRCCMSLCYEQKVIMSAVVVQAPSHLTI